RLSVAALGSHAGPFAGELHSHVVPDPGAARRRRVVAEHVLGAQLAQEPRERGLDLADVRDVGDAAAALLDRALELGELAAVLLRPAPRRAQGPAALDLAAVAAHAQPVERHAGAPRERAHVGHGEHALD